MKAEIYVPALAESLEDLKVSYDLLEPARLKGFQTGLMIVIRPQGLSRERIQRQIDNLDYFLKKSADERPRVFGMHPNMPLSGPERLNFLTNPDWSEEYVRRGIEMVAKLPQELTPFTGRSISFHLNTLITSDKWMGNVNSWTKTFEIVLGRINNLADFGKGLGVSIAIE
ncbi:MAG: hypothetical protein WAV56_04460, partial [Microgenomates group bacterium]